MRTLRIARLLVAFAALACAPVPSFAQRPPVERPDRALPRSQDRADLEGRVRARFGEMVRQRLGLDEAQAARLGEVVRAFEADRIRLAGEEAALRRGIEAALLEGGESDPEARALLERMVELRQEEARLSAAEQERLLEVLTPRQLLRFHAMREELGQRIRRLRTGPGGGPGPGPSLGPGGRRRPGVGGLPGGGGFPRGRVLEPVR